MKGDFHQFKGNSGKEPLQSVSKKANHSNGFTKGNKAVAEFAASPQGTYFSSILNNITMCALFHTNVKSTSKLCICVRTYIHVSLKIIDNTVFYLLLN